MEERTLNCHSNYYSEEGVYNSSRGGIVQGTLKIALPSGTLQKSTLEFLLRAGILIKEPKERKMRVPAMHTLIKEAWFLRPQHIPEIVSKGLCDVGICGADWVLENRLSGNNVETIFTLPYGKVGRNGRTKVVVFCAKDEKEANLTFAKEVVSEYPHLTADFFLKKYGRSITVRFSHGTTEALVPVLYRWGVCLVDRGKTLRANGLKIVEVITKSSTVLIAQERLGLELKEELKDIFRETIWE